MEVSLARSLWLLPTLAYFLCFYPSYKYESNAPPKEVNKIEETYDFIIIGGGTAGSVLANRLSEDESSSVLLLDAGGQEPQEVQIPTVAPFLQLTDLDWQYKTAPSSTSCLAMEDHRCNLPAGKVLGGSSSINFMLYVRGNKKDYDRWEQVGNTGWAYENVLHYFKKSEKNMDKKYAQDEYFHGSEGYQIVMEPKWKTPLADALLAGAKELGYNTLDVNAEDQVGFMLPQGLLYRGSRFSASRAFLQPIRRRSNLSIMLHSLVTKVLFDDDKRARVVLFEKEGMNYSVKSNKEIILSAGALSSPHLLMLSGVGPAANLRKFRVPLIVDLPVGRNLQDHVAGQQIFIVDKPLSLKRSRLESFASIYQYIVWGSGPLTTFGGIEGIGFANTRYSNISLGWPDIEIQFLSGSVASDQGGYLRHCMNLRQKYWDEYLKPLSSLDTFTIITKLMRPRSRGFVELNSTNPKDMPNIVSNYLTEPYDVLVLSQGLKFARALGETKAFKRYGSRFYSKPLPGCEGFRSRSDKYLECYLRHLTLTIYHYSGTAKMGPFWDPEAVVDPQLRVYGTSGLRVVDASIFPFIPTGNTNAAVMMVAEKAADMIKEYWRNPTEEPANKLTTDIPPNKTSTERIPKFHFFSALGQSDDVATHKRTKRDTTNVDDADKHIHSANNFSDESKSNFPGIKMIKEISESQTVVPRFTLNKNESKTTYPLLKTNVMPSQIELVTLMIEKPLFSSLIEVTQTSHSKLTYPTKSNIDGDNLKINSSYPNQKPSETIVTFHPTTIMKNDASILQTTTTVMENISLVETLENKHIPTISPPAPIVELNLTSSQSTNDNNDHNIDDDYKNDDTNNNDNNHNNDDNETWDTEHEDL